MRRIVHLEMKTHGMIMKEDPGFAHFIAPVRQASLLPHRLHLVSVHELQDLRQWLARGADPPDFELKLHSLSRGDLAHRSLAQNCRTIVELLRAVYEGSYKGATSANCDRLLRALAYVRKDDDAIPDYRPDGFKDDLQEMRLLTSDLHSLLHDFKAWRLRHQVPAMW